MSKQYRAVYRDVGQVVVGELVRETKATIELRKPAILHTQQNGESLNLQFIPMELLSMNPPIPIRALMKKESIPEEGLNITFSKDQLLHADLDLNQEIFDGYDQSVNPPSIITPNSGGLVSPDGTPVSSGPPPVHDLF